jgi:hypothetical protein
LIGVVAVDGARVLTGGSASLFSDTVEGPGGRGAEMWVLNSVVFLVPAAVIAMQDLSPRFLTRSVTRAEVSEI